MFDKVLLVEARDVDQIIGRMAINRPQTDFDPHGNGGGARLPVPRKSSAGWLFQVKAQWSYLVRSAGLSLALLPRRASTSSRRIIQRHCQAFFRRLGEMGQVSVEFQGFEDVEDWRGAVVSPNHPSLLDALFLFSKIPDVDCVIGRTPWHDPLLAIPARRADYIPNIPAGAMLRECRKRLERGANIMIFPEGTRTSAGVLNPFQRGFALPVIQSGAEVRTIFIECDSMALGKGYSFFKNARPPLHFRISTGEIFKAGPGQRARDFSMEIEDYFRRCLRRNGDCIARIPRA